MKKLGVFTSCLLLLSIITWAQTNPKGLPLIRNYSPKDYQGGNQNWAIAQGKDGLMYFGNGDVTIYDGHDFSAVTLTNNPTIRALEVDNNGRVYVGATAEFGYLSPNVQGRLIYHSFIERLDSADRPLADVWQIVLNGGNVFFRTSEALYEYIPKQDTIRILRPEGRFHYIFNVNGTLYVRDRGIGLKKLENNELKLVRGGELFAEVVITGLLPYKDNKLILATKEDGVYTYDLSPKVSDDNLLQDFSPHNNFLSQVQLYKSRKLRDNQHAFSSYFAGAMILDDKGEIQNWFNKELGLTDDQVYFMYENEALDGSPLWLGHGNGFSKVELNSPISVWNETLGLEGKPTAISKFNGKLYVGTWSSGLYVLDDTDKGYQMFRVLKNQPSNCVSLLEIKLADTNGKKNDKLLLGGDFGAKELDGTVVINNQQATHLYASVNYPNRVFISTTAGLFIAEFKDNKWHPKSVSDIDVAIYNIREDKKGNLWLYSDFGLYKVSDINAAVPKVDFYDGSKGLPNSNYFDIYDLGEFAAYFLDSGFYYYDQDKDYFFPNDTLNEFMGPLSKQLISLNQIKDNFWLGLCLEGNRRFFYTKDTENKLDTINLKRIPDMTLNDVFVDENNLMWLAGSEGLYTYDLNFKPTKKDFKCLIRQVNGEDSLYFAGHYCEENSSGTGLQIAFEQNDLQRPIIEFKNNQLTFDYAAPFFDNENEISYSFKLEGQEKPWSKWSKDAKWTYNYLQEGEYIFRVKAKNVYGIVSSEGRFAFIVLPPWYRSTLAYIAYALFSIGFVFLVVKLYTRRLRKQNEALEQTVKERTAEVVRQRDDIERKNTILEKQKEEIRAQAENLKEANVAVTKAKEKIEHANKEITDSINYASNIQGAMLPSPKEISSALPESFVLFKPRDIVSGDFYWFGSTDDSYNVPTIFGDSVPYEDEKLIITAVDCTGHGVPGAFMSMMGDAYLNQIIKAQRITDPSKILNELHNYIQKGLKQKETNNRDGMDMALCVIDLENQKLEFSGAKNPLIYIQDNEIFQIKGDKEPIGGRVLKDGEQRAFTKHLVDISKPTWVYIFSDGFQDQFGGPKGRKFMTKKFRELLFEIHQKPMQEQKTILETTIIDWMGVDYKQIDDILVIGIKLGD